MKIPKEIALTSEQRLQLGKDRKVYDESIDKLKSMHPCDEAVDYYMFCVETILYNNKGILAGKNT